ncbi:MAG TPA: hypothetical protein VGF22_10025 [Acidimicrobiales bacterium]
MSPRPTRGLIASWRPVVSKTWFTAWPTLTDEFVTAWNERVSHDDVAWLLGEPEGPVGRLNGRKYFVKGMRTVRVPLLGGPVFGRPVVVVAASDTVSMPKGRADWLVHGGPVGTEGPVCDPEHRWLDVSAHIWGGPMGADEIAALITEADSGAVPDTSQWKTLHG